MFFFNLSKLANFTFPTANFGLQNHQDSQIFSEKVWQVIVK